MSVLSVLAGFLVSLLITAPFVWALTTWMCYSVDSIKYELGKYTTAYRCVKCDQVYRLPQWVCEKCGHEHEGLHVQQALIHSQKTGQKHMGRQPRPRHSALVAPVIRGEYTTNKHSIHNERIQATS